MIRIALWMVLALGCCQAHAQESLFCTLTGASEGACRTVAVDGPVTLVGAGTQLTFLYFPEEGDPLRVLSMHFPAFIRSIVLQDELAYLAMGRSGLVILDLSEFDEPQVLSVLDTGDYVVDVALDGQVAYLANSWSGLMTVNVSDPANPAILGHCQTNQARAVVVQGGMAYLADHVSGLKVLDVGNPALPRVVGNLPSNDASLDVAVADSVVYLADGFAGLRVVNVVNPGSPTQLRAHDTPGYAENLDLQGDMLYLADGDAGLRIISVALPQWPNEEGFVDTPGSARCVAVQDNMAYVADEQAGLRILSVEIPAFAAEVGYYDAPGYAHGISAAGDRVLVVDTMAGQLSLVGVGPWEDLPVMGVHSIGSSSWSTCMQGDLAVQAAGQDGLRILDLADPESIQELAIVALDGFCQVAELVGSFAYVLVYSPGNPEISTFYMFDLTTPATPTQIAMLELPGRAYGLAVENNLVYVACGEEGLRILDVTWPSFALETGAIQTSGVAHAVAVSEDRAYVADGLIGNLVVIDVTDPEEPAYLNHFITEGWTVDVVVQDGLAFVADYYEGLRVVDVHDPNNLREVAFCDTPGRAVGVEVMGGIIYVADSEAGLARIEYDPAAAVAPRAGADPALFTLGDPVPNPFNPRTVIPFTLASRQDVRLQVYDMAGRLVSELVDASLPAGDHEAVLDGRNLPSGMYVAHLSSRQGTASRKLLLMK